MITLITWSATREDSHFDRLTEITTPMTLIVEDRMMVEVEMTVVGIQQTAWCTTNGRLLCAIPGNHKCGSETSNTTSSLFESTVGVLAFAEPAYKHTPFPVFETAQSEKGVSEKQKKGCARIEEP
jgi:hypothetical protein